MTAIIGYVDKKNKRVYMAADSYEGNSWTYTILRENKVFIRNNNMLFGCCGTGRMAQLIQHCLKIPKHPKGMSVEAYLIGKLVPAIYQTLVKHSAEDQAKRGLPDGGTILIGYKSQLFKVQGDLTVTMSVNDFAATGSCSETLLGAFVGLRANCSTEDKAYHLMIKALEITSTLAENCRPPFLGDSIEFE